MSFHDENATPRTLLCGKLQTIGLKSGSKADGPIELSRDLSNSAFSPIRTNKSTLALSDCENLLTLPPIMSPGGFPVFDLDLTLGTTLNDSSDSQTLDFQILEHHLEILVKKVEQNHSIKRHRPSDEADSSEITLRMPKTLEPSHKSPKLTNKLAGTFPPELYAKWTEQPSRKDVILKTQSNPVNIQNPSLRQRIPTPIFPQAVKIQRCQSTPPILSSCSSESGRLTIDQVADLIETRCLNVDGKETSFTRIKIIDARYQYEFDGGHIKGATNIPKELDASWQEQLKSLFFSACETRDDNTVIIMHCEFSSQRGPALFKWFRKYDRQRPENEYPALFYKNLYLMVGGYKKFYEAFTQSGRDIFGVNGYVSELHENFAEKNKSIKRRNNSYGQRNRFITRSCDRRLRSAGSPGSTPTKRPR